MRIYAIDPGNVKSAYAIYDNTQKVLIGFGKYENTHIRQDLIENTLLGNYDLLAIEYPRPRGQPLYHQLVDTVFWIGRFVESAQTNFWPVDRKDVKMHLVGKPNAKDSNIRMAVINRFSSASNLGGGKVPEIGISAKRGPLYGVSQDVWQALAVAIYCSEVKKPANAGICLFN